MRQYLIVFFLITTCFGQENPSLYVRMNQAGSLPKDIKSAIIFSNKVLNEKNYYIINKGGKIISGGILKESLLKYEGFNFCYTLDFSSLTDPGEYRLRIKGSRDTRFIINEQVFNAVRDSLIIFFKVQRCGPTDPLLHEPCHLSDATSVPGFSDNSIVDVTGGWHDAGDYIKFLSTSAYTTYMLLFAYEFDKEKFGFDNDDNSIPDILEEARVGLDWLLRCRLRDDLLITQVQDLRDHEVGWRLPEDDTLRFDRPGYTGIGKNIIGIYTAALSIGARIWSERFYDYDYSDKLLRSAEGVFSVYSSVPDLDLVNSGVYQDDNFAGKLSLGAVELYLSTKKVKYLTEAKIFADTAKSDFWWSWGNINSLAHYRLAKLGEDNKEYIFNNLIYFNSFMSRNLFGEGIEYTWGTTNSMLGVALQAILYKDLTGDTRFDSLAVFQRDYVLGRNPWGVSFIYGIGNTYPRNLHSQIAYFKKGYLPGALSAGPAPRQLLELYNIKRTSQKYNQFNTGKARYFDDYNDYITNEPTITGNATALFVFGFFSSSVM
jgi:endoglucanase